MIEPQLDLLKLLADHLKNVVSKTPANFSMYKWRREGTSCGTVACAIGHAYYVPEIREAGLEFTEADNEGCSYPKYRGDYNYTAIAKLFKISRNDAERLFCPWDYYDYPSIDIVVDRIETFIKEKK